MDSLTEKRIMDQILKQVEDRFQDRNPLSHQEAERMLAVSPKLRAAWVKRQMEMASDLCYLDCVGK